MARPSMKAQRREEILDAFERCVAKSGVKGATLEKVAEEAGLARALIRHNVGNREELFDAAVERFLTKSNADFRNVVGMLPQANRIPTLIDWMFDHNHSDAHFVKVSNEFITEASEDEALATKMHNWTREFVGLIADELARNFPERGRDEIEVVAVGFSGIYSSAEAIGAMGSIDTMRDQSKRAVQCLVSTLK